MSEQKKQNDEIDQIIDDLGKEDEKHKKALQRLLDKAISDKDKYLAVSAKMGSNRSYISSVSLRWFADVNFASDLSIFDEHRDKDSKGININKDTLDMLSQRKPDWSRQLIMTVYLAIRNHHKFPPALLVAYEDWILDKNHDNWGMDKKALKDSLPHEPLDSKNWVVNLNHRGTKFYALDGQHRLMAVRGLRELIQGNLSKKNKEGKNGKAITLDHILKYHTQGEVDESTIRRKLDSIMDEERMGVEIIPAVQRGETRDEAFMRLRQIFVDVNQNARSLEKSELALLDEENGFRIVARRVMISHELFRAGDAGDSLRVDMKSSQLSETSEDYTTLQTIANIAESYLEQQEDFSHWGNEMCGIKGAGMIRPGDEELGKGEDKLLEYFNAIKELPSHKRMMKGTPTKDIRSDEANVLFRPIAQEALAGAIGELEREKGLSPQDICKKLAKKDDIKFSDLKLDELASPFFGVLWHPVNGVMRKQSSDKELATQMFCYLLSGGMEDEEREFLKEKVFESRRVTLDNVEPAEAIGLDGKQTTLDKFELPNPW